jgi:hypothetical protein
LEHFDRAAELVPPEEWERGVRQAYLDLKKRGK